MSRRCHGCRDKFQSQELLPTPLLDSTDGGLSVRLLPLCELCRHELQLAEARAYDKAHAELDVAT